jgi:hypothetical protein
MTVSYTRFDTGATDRMSWPRRMILIKITIPKFRDSFLFRLSEGLILREDMPMSHAAFARESKAVAEPRASTWTDRTPLVPETTPWSEYSSGSFPGTCVMLDQPS